MLRGELSSVRVSVFFFSFAPYILAHPLFFISVWASKNYVDPGRVGIWGWVSHVSWLFSYARHGRLF
jgi:hypothetical protein